MKTPREILFEHHRHAEPKLDAVRQKVLAALPNSAGTIASQPIGRESLQALVSKLWFELVWPSRRAWAGLAALWLAVLVCNLQMRASFRPAQSVRPAPSREVVRAFEEQRRLLAELLPPANLTPVQPPPPVARPRSERPQLFRAC